MSEEFYNRPLPSYQNSPQYQIPVPEEHHWKNQYMRIDFEDKSFNHLRDKFARLDIPTEKLEDLVEELMIIINNAGKMKVEMREIPLFLDDFEKYWDTYCIYILKNSRWVDELNHIREYVLILLEQEYHKSINGWQGDNILTYRGEQKQAYSLKQEVVQTGTKRGWFKNKKQSKIVNSPAAQGFNLSQPQQR